jgi:hypothetical protein
MGVYFFFQNTPQKHLEYPTETSRIPHRKNKNTPQKHLEYPIEKIKTPPHGKHPEHPEYTIAFFIVSLSKP